VDEDEEADAEEDSNNTIGESYQIDPQLSDRDFFKDYIKKIYGEKIVEILRSVEVDTLYKLAQVDPSELVQWEIPIDVAEDLVGTAQMFCKSKSVFI